MDNRARPIGIAPQLVGLGLICPALFLYGTGAGAFIIVGIAMAVVGIVFGILEILAAFVGLIVVIVTLSQFAAC